MANQKVFVVYSVYISADTGLPELYKTYGKVRDGSSWAQIAATFAEQKQTEMREGGYVEVLGRDAFIRRFGQVNYDATPYVPATT